MNFHIEVESSEASEVFIRREKSTVRVDRHTGGLRERESRTLVVAWIAVMGHFFQISFDQSSCFAWFWVRVWSPSGSCSVCVRVSQPRWILAKRPMGSWRHLLWGDTASLFDLQGAFLHICRQEGLLRGWGLWGLLSLIWAGPSLPYHPAFMEFLLLWSFCPRGRNCSAWGPSMSCLNTCLPLCSSLNRDITDSVLSKYVMLL